MLTLQAKEKEIENLTPDEEFIRGTVGAECQVNFDEFWKDYEKTVVFKRDNREPINIIVNSLSNEVEIPYEILDESGKFRVGVFGITENEVLPTLWSGDIKILYGTDTHGTTPPKYTPSEIDQLRLSKQNKLTAGDNITIDENNVISASGGETTDYQELDNKPKINDVELNGEMTANDLSLVDKETFDKTIGDIETALDKIIEIQEACMNGSYVNGVTITDKTTNLNYKLYVDNEKLTMEVV